MSDPEKPEGSMTDRIVAFLDEHGSSDTNAIAEGLGWTLKQARMGLHSAKRCRAVVVLTPAKPAGLASEPAVYGIAPRPPRGVVPNVNSVFRLAEVIR